MTLIRSKFAKSLNWNLLKTYHEIVISKGVTSASIALSRKQSTISHSLKQLEDELGIKLCMRGPGGFKLTDEGHVLFEYCSTIFDKIDEIPNNLENLSEEIHGQLKLQFISNIVCPTMDKILSNYNQRYPYVELDISIVPWEGIPKAILSNQVDIGIAPVSIKYPELKYDLLYRESQIAYCSNNHYLYGKKITDFTKLAEDMIILTGNDEPEQLTKFRLKYNIGHHIAGISSHLEEAKRLTVIGAGICFLPEGFTEIERKNGQLWPITNVIDELTLDIFIITHPQIPEHLTRQYFLNEVLKYSFP